MSAPNLDWRARRVHPNSLAAFALVPIAPRQREVFEIIAQLYRDGFQPCDTDIADRLQWPISWVCPSRKELLIAGHVVKGGDKLGPHGRRVSCWAPVARQLDLFTGTAP